MGRFVPLILAAAGSAAVVSFGLVIEMTSARAETPGLDTCLVGVWAPDGNGAVEWMRRNMPPGMALPMADVAGHIVLNSDGSYSAGGSGSAQAMTTPSGGETGARAEMTTRAAGRWSAENGTLVLSPTSETMSGRMQITNPDGSSRDMPMPSPGAMGPMQYEYSCTDAMMETRLRFPGMADPMVQSYTRAETTGE